MGGLRIGADLKTISMWNIKQEGLRAKLHREIIERDCHLSAAMYCETAALDQFFWIFVSKDGTTTGSPSSGHHRKPLELGMLEYRKASARHCERFRHWRLAGAGAEDYTDGLNDFDVRAASKRCAYRRIGE